MSEPAEPQYVEFGGEDFRVAEKFGAMALMRFAHIAKGGADSNDLEGLAAMYDLLQQCIHEDEWQRFQEKALAIRAEGDELMAVTRQVVTGKTKGRPTSRPSDSSDGPLTTPPSSEGDSSSPAEPEPEYMRVVRRLEAEGRPDKALMVLRTQQAMATSAA